MSSLEEISNHIVVDKKTQYESRSCVLGGISLGKYSIAIDSGDSLEAGTGLRKGLESYFKVPVKYLFLTHTHNDHRGGRDAFNDLTLIASNKCIDNMPKRISFSKWKKELFDQELIIQEDKLSVEFHLVGGHSIGFSIAYFPNERILFAGDLFITEPINFGLPFMGFYQNNPKRTGNPEEYLAAFEKFKLMKIDIIVPGHGELILNPRKYLDEQSSFYKSLKSFFVTEIEEGKELEEIKMPVLKPFERAHEIIESKTKKSQALRFLDNYFNWIKKSFYNYYSGEFEKLGNS